jgi:hypothetical protein
LGFCKCYYGWKGPYCNTSIDYIAAYSNGDTWAYEDELVISQPPNFEGTIVGYRLTSYPTQYADHFGFNEATGIITWPYPPRGSHYFEIQAYNEESSDYNTW